MAKYRYTISQKKKMEKLLQKQNDDMVERLNTILQKVGEDVVHKMQVYINQYWYNRYEPKNYIRLKEDGGFLSAISFKVEKQKVNIFFDWDKMEYYPPEDGFLGNHVGFDGNPFTEGLIQYIDQGSFYSETLKKRKGSYFLSKTQKWLEKTISKEVEKEIRNAGLKSFQVAFGNSVIIK